MDAPRDPRALVTSWQADIAVLAPDAGPARWSAEADLLLAGWSEPHRDYHTLEHLAELFAALAELEQAGEIDAGAARVARVAGWYHDLAYDPRAEPGSNEHRSATLARDHLHRLGVDTDVVDLVEAVVMMTADHQAERDIAAAGARRAAVMDAFHDADLWILAAPPGRFDDYCAQVRREYAHLPDESYAAGRAAVLQRLAGGGPVYLTPHAHQHWQDRALSNVARELARL